MTLDQFLSDNRITQAAFAASVGVDQSTISRLQAGTANPTLSLLNRICEATDGLVRPDDFLPRASAKIEAAE